MQNIKENSQQFLKASLHIFFAWYTYIMLRW